MYNEELEQLINAALADGVLTEKEKQILFKKAQSMGIDLDEFEMVLDAKLVVLEKAEKEKAAQSAPKSNKLGDVRKCPQCGAVIGSFKMICPECGFEFSGIGPNQFVEKFSSELQKALDKQNEGKGFLYFSEKQKNNAIIKAESIFVKNYPLPMTKEDCVEMLNYILPKTHLSDSNGATNAWRNKYYAILSKLERENHNNPKIKELVASYKEQAKISILGRFAIWYRGKSIIIKVILWYVILCFISIAILGIVEASDSKNEVKTDSQVIELVEKGDINGAKAAINAGGDSQPLYNYYMDKKMWDDAEEFIPKEYSEVTKDAYYNYCKKAVTSMCADGDFDAAKKFIKRKVVFYSEYDNEDNYYHNEWNTTIVAEKLNAIVDNY